MMRPATPSFTSSVGDSAQSRPPRCSASSQFGVVRQFGVARKDGGLRKVEVTTDFEHDLLTDWLLAERHAADQGVVADHADRSRDTARVFVNRHHGFARKQSRRFSTSGPDAHRDVSRRLRQREGPQLATQRDALLELPQRRIVQPAGKFWLTGEHERQQLFARGFDVRQQTNFFQELDAQRLRFVHEQRRDLHRGYVVP